MQCLWLMIVIISVNTWKTAKPCASAGYSYTLSRFVVDSLVPDGVSEETFTGYSLGRPTEPRILQH
jgi:hypothetical protein